MSRRMRNAELRSRVRTVPHGSFSITFKAMAKSIADFSRALNEMGNQIKVALATMPKGDKGGKEGE